MMNVVVTESNGRDKGKEKMEISHPLLPPPPPSSEADDFSLCSPPEVPGEKEGNVDELSLLFSARQSINELYQKETPTTTADDGISNEFRVCVPDISKVNTWKRLRKEHKVKQQGRKMWLVIPPKRVHGILGLPDDTKDEDMKEEDDDDHEIKEEKPTLPKAIVYLRQFIYGTLRLELIHLLNVMIKKDMIPQLGKRKDDALVLVPNLSNQLAAWAVYFEKPHLLIEQIKEANFRLVATDTFSDLMRPCDKIAKDNGNDSMELDMHPQTTENSDDTTMSTSADIDSLEEEEGEEEKEEEEKESFPDLTVGRRERDAVMVLEARSGKSKRALPINNDFVQDMLISKDPHYLKSKAVRQNVIQILADAILGIQNNRLKSGSFLLRRARYMSSGDGVLLALNPEYNNNNNNNKTEGSNQSTDVTYEDVRKFIILRSEEARQILGLGTPPITNLKEAGKLDKDLHDAELLNNLNAWVDDHQKSKTYDQGYTITKFEEGLDLQDILKHPPYGDKEFGWKIIPEERLKFYNPRIIEPKTKLPPMKTNVPLPKEILGIFLQYHGKDLFATNIWQLFPDTVVPSCPIMSLLYEGIQPFHRGAYALFNEYIIVFRAAIDRFSTKAVTPPKNEYGEGGLMGGKDISLAAGRYKHVCQRMEYCGSAFSFKEWNKLPEWCGDWFLPHAFLPKPSNAEELDAWYPTDDPSLHPWLKNLFRTKGALQASYDTIIQEFDKACKTADKIKKEEEEEADQKRMKESKNEDQDGGGDDDVTRRLKNFADRLSEPDETKEGRAETILGLTIYWLHNCIVKQLILQFHNSVNAIRKQYGPGVDCGNGFVHVRPAAYYDDLYLLQLWFMTQLLQAYERTLLIINCRWVNIAKAKSCLLPNNIRLDPTYTANAHSDTVKLTIQRRREYIESRCVLGNQYDQFSKGFVRLPDREGKFDPMLGKSEDWTNERIRSKGQEARPDLPTYKEMILFDHTSDESPYVQSEGGRASDDLDELSKRFNTMMLRAEKIMIEHPSWVMRHHELPGVGVEELKSKKRSAGYDLWEQGSESSKQKPSLPNPFSMKKQQQQQQQQQQHKKNKDRKERKRHRKK